MRYLTVVKASLLLGAFLLLAPLVQAQKTIPKPTGYLVNDFAGLMSRSEVEQLGRKLSDYARETSTQIVVVTENSLEGEDDFEYSNRLAREWGIGGSKEKSNGVLLYVAKAERKVRIQAGYGTEGFLTDALSKRIIEQTIVPAFRAGNYYAGIDQATSTIMEAGKGEYTNEGGGKRQSDGGRAVFLVFLLLFALVVFLFIYGRFRKNKGDDGGYYRGGRYDERDRGGGGGWIFFPTGGWGGGGGGGNNQDSGDGWGGFSGGGFGDFGGGDFGGGGAGGDW